MNILSGNKCKGDIKPWQAIAVTAVVFATLAYGFYKSFFQ